MQGHAAGASIVYSAKIKPPVFQLAQGKTSFYLKFVSQTQSAADFNKMKAGEWMPTSILPTVQLLMQNM